jgi:hypothetical protein
MLTKLVNNQPSKWEEHLGDCLTALNNSVSSVTGYSPFYLLYGRRARLPLTKLLPVNSAPFGNRLDNLARALQEASRNTQDSRRYNKERLAARANAGTIQVGDSVVLKAPERVTLTSRWDPQWEVTRVRGSTLWLRQQNTGQTKIVHREKVRVADPNMVWDEVAPRPIRNRRKAARVLEAPEPMEVDPPEQTEEAQGDNTYTRRRGLRSNALDDLEEIHPKCSRLDPSAHRPIPIPDNPVESLKRRLRPTPYRQKRARLELLCFVSSFCRGLPWC